MLDATAGADVGAPYVIPEAGPFLKEVGKKPGKLKVAFSTKPMLGKNVHADCVQGVEETVQLLQELGHEVEEAAPADRWRGLFAGLPDGDCRAHARGH